MDTKELGQNSSKQHIAIGKLGDSRWINLREKDKEDYKYLFDNKTKSVFICMQLKTTACHPLLAFPARPAHTAGSIIYRMLSENKRQRYPDINLFT